VHQRQPQRIGNVLLVERKLDPAVAHHAHALRAAVQVHEQHGHALAGVAPAGGDQVVVHHLFLARGQPGDVVAQLGLGMEQAPEPVAREGAQRDVGDGLDAVGLAVGEFVLQADEVAGQQKAQYLPPAVAQGLVAEGPPRVEREELRAVAVLLDDRAARFDTPAPTRNDWMVLSSSSEDGRKASSRRNAQSSQGLTPCGGGLRRDSPRISRFTIGASAVSFDISPTPCGCLDSAAFSLQDA
jgi:hypothetical protein